MNEAVFQRLLATRGAEFPPVAKAIAELPEDHPVRVEVESQRAAAQAHAAAIAAARAQAGQGSLVERVAALEARIAALGG